ncbi:tumor necrosis factor receptor superfamily member 10C precursor, partial [Daubentonia madagascariensis]
EPIYQKIVQIVPPAVMDWTTPLIGTPSLPAYPVRFVIQMKTREVPARQPETESVSANQALTGEKIPLSSARSAAL